METIQDCINWDKHLELGIPFIDRQHKNLVRVINNLSLACLHSPETANHHFMNTAFDAVDSIHHHYRTDEKLMLLLEYQGYAQHRKEHDRFIEAVFSHSENSDGSRRIIPIQFVNFLKDWILSHITVKDQEFINYILELKQYGKLEAILSRRPEYAPLSA